MNKIKNAHITETKELEKILDTNYVKGLDQEEVIKRQEIYGKNKLPSKKREGMFMLFIRQFNQPLVYILLFATLITALMKEWVDSGVILGVVLINSLMGFLQESKALKAIEQLANTIATDAVVIRDSKKQTVSSTELVPGDIVFLQSGDMVPADIRLFKVNQLRAEEAALTGESMPVEKHTQIVDDSTVLAERNNMLYASTFITFGQGYGLVVGTAINTEIGKISTLLENTTKLETPLVKKIKEFSHILVYVISALAILTFIIGLFRGNTWLEMLKASIALAVGAIPEGLPAALTATLAIGVSRMAKKNAIIRKLPVVETLGSTTVICSDKTGTLTENQMTVRKIFTNSSFYSVSGQGYMPEGEITSDDDKSDPKNDTALIKCLETGVLCNDSSYLLEDNEPIIQGNPTEVSLYVAAHKMGTVKDSLQNDNPRLDEMPFESERQYMATLCKNTEGKKTIYVKGALEKIIKICSHTMEEDGTLIDLDVEAIDKAYKKMASDGLRVLTFAIKDTEIDDVTEEAIGEGGFILVGLQGMIDPPRKEAISAVKTCHDAGINVKMITGDHGITALEIARQLGIANEENHKVISGGDLELLNSEELIEAVSSTNVFARVSPEQKLRLVEALQTQGHVVAMTGDGVNDAPALKRADIGIAMGIAGTEVAKDSSDMILTDDNFASIEAAVEEGRGAFDNLTKFIIWTLPTNIGEGLVILLAILLGTILPIEPVQILWINMTTAVLLGLMLAFEPKEPGIMLRRPRKPNQQILTKELSVKILIVSMLLLGFAFYVFQFEQNIGSLESARTAAATVFVIIEMAYLFNSRSLHVSLFKLGLFTNPFIWMGTSLMLILQALFIFNPFFNIAFKTAPFSIQSWQIIAIGAVATFVIIEIEKIITNKIIK